MAEALLEFRDVRAGYGEAVVLDNVSFSLAEGGSMTVLGRNGVGKTTLFLTAMGFVRVARGSVSYKGQDISRVASYKRARLGVGWVPQERDIFPSLTVEENLTVAARPGRWDLNAVYGLFPRLKERRTNMGNQLSGGEQQMLTIARTLMTNPGVLLLDEPLEGLAPIIVEELTAAIRKMSEAEGMGLMLVEQHAEVALGLTKDAIIIERGSIAHAAPSAELLQDRATLDRYLGLKLGAG
ncbi:MULTISPECIES: ABC transporter ATP-binding protein [unclassified Aminobacter]|uniref:ABC transporter ATP-binding protein n=1 Tax=unclassified Aminobacter TaxID=2644704 RepID=UPI000463034C|nr:MULTISPECIES: ABC transporter ATP-binding protein [unclassified Aminobacter]TWG67559.1 branched-chain amino acid transport system ATP-binding protein [Aminobacter sp. J44]TWH35522.1 branched-chain amino acid transport system ATP-binding protein [Aminobacter sp. J15]